MIWNGPGLGLRTFKLKPYLPQGRYKKGKGLDVKWLAGFLSFNAASTAVPLLRIYRCLS